MPPAEVAKNGVVTIPQSVFETAPAQLLNAYGQGQFVVLPDDKVWHALCQPLATGAKYGTELASEEYLSCHYIRIKSVAHIRERCRCVKTIP